MLDLYPYIADNEEKEKAILQNKQLLDRISESASRLGKVATSGLKSATKTDLDLVPPKNLEPMPMSPVLNANLMQKEPKKNLLDRPFYEIQPIEKFDAIEYLNEPLDKLGVPRNEIRDNYVMLKNEKAGPSFQDKKPVPANEKKPVAVTEDKATEPKFSKLNLDDLYKTIDEIAALKENLPKKVLDKLPEDIKQKTEIPVTKNIDTTPAGSPTSDGSQISDYYNIIGKALITFGPAMIASLTGEKDMSTAWKGGLAGLKVSEDYDRMMLEDKYRNLALQQKSLESDKDWVEVEPTFIEEQNKNLKTIMNKRTGEIKVLPYEVRDIGQKKEITPNWVEIDPIFDPETKKSYRAIMNKNTGEILRTKDVVLSTIDRKQATPIIKEVEDPKTGQVKYVVADPTIEGDVESKIGGQLRGFAPAIVKMPGSEELAKIPRQTGSKINYLSGGSGKYIADKDTDLRNMNLGTAKIISNLNEDLQKDDAYKKAFDSLKTVEQGLLLIERNSPVTRGPFQSLVARGIGREVGALTEGDIARFGGSKSLMDRLEQFVEEIMTGKMTETNRRYYKELLEITHKKVFNDLNEIKNKYYSAYKPLLYRVGGKKAVNYVEEQIIKPSEQVNQNMQKEQTGPNKGLGLYREIERRKGTK